MRRCKKVPAAAVACSTAAAGLAVVARTTKLPSLAVAVTQTATHLTRLAEEAGGGRPRTAERLRWEWLAAILDRAAEVSLLSEIARVLADAAARLRGSLAKRLQLASCEVASLACAI